MLRKTIKLSWYDDFQMLKMEIKFAEGNSQLMFIKLTFQPIFLILDVVCRLMGSTRNATKPWSTPPPPRRHNHPTS